MENPIQCLKFCHFEKRRWLFMVSLVAITYILCQFLLLPYGKALQSLLPSEELHLPTKLISSSISSDVYNMGGKLENGPERVENLKGDKDFQSKNFDDSDDKNTISDTKEAILSRHGLSLDRVLEQRNDIGFVLENKSTNVTDTDADDFVEVSELRNDTDIGFVFDKTIEIEKNLLGTDVFLAENTTSSIKMVVTDIGSAFVNGSSSSEAETRLIPIGESRFSTTLRNDSLSMNITTKRKMRCDMPPKTVMPIDEMERLLARHRRSSRAMRPRWSSIRDQEIVAAKLQIENAPTANGNRELYGPLFRNVSQFKRSYELMEQTLKIYIYKEGKKPIFHQPILKGLYASEGWFMKLIVGNKQYLVKDPNKAHLFYMPFSSRMLEHSLYVRNSHNRTNLRQFLKHYAEELAAKYKFWNRTGGADHFLVACHDWAPYETRHHMEQCIKALCNADVTAGFKIGRDVSLPETYVRSPRNPLRDLGGYPPKKRHILAFYAGNMHGYLRPILLNHWKNKDHNMKILGPMPPGVASKMSYIEHMKSSKYCLCPKGYEVNSPRVVEAIFYECVPVIISDNFVPPFFDVLNWEAFSLIVAEKDIPKLKDILVSIPEKRYLEMQLAVKKVQRHFLWHAKPLKYDIFHMTLHSIWYNRVYQIKPR